MASAIRMIQSRSRSEIRPAAKSLCAWRDRSASLARTSSLFAPGRKKEASERHLRWIGASGPAVRRLCSGRSEKRHAACLGPPLGLPPNQTEGQSPASTHLSSRGNAFFLLLFGWGKSSLRIAKRRDKKLLRDIPRSLLLQLYSGHLTGKGCLYFVASTDFHSPFTIPARICAALLPLPECSNA